MVCNILESCIINEQIGVKDKCTNSRKNCIEVSDCRSIVKCEEKGKKYSFNNENKKHIVLYKVDGGVIFNVDTINKCDYLYIINNTSNTKEYCAILVELKGTEIKKAFKQISATIDTFPKVFDKCNAVFGRVIGKQSAPRITADPSYVNLSNKLRKRNGNLKIKEKQFEERESELNL